MVIQEVKNHHPNAEQARLTGWSRAIARGEMSKGFHRLMVPVAMGLPDGRNARPADIGAAEDGRRVA